LLESAEPPPIEWLSDVVRSRFIADPFAVQRGENLTILVEEFDQIQRTGRISAMCSGDGGRSFSSLAPISGAIFDSPGHKSYPYLFEHDGEIYCVPEPSDRREAVLYRAVEFPRKWERVCVLMEGIALVDPTVLFYAGSWWMFYTDRDRGSNVKL